MLSLLVLIGDITSILFSKILPYRIPLYQNVSIRDLKFMAMKNSQVSLLPSIIKAKCPRCREGNMFTTGNLYSRQFSDMYPNCPCCGQTFEPEPGFYYGAMYVSFGLSTGIFLAVILALNFLVEEITLPMVLISVIIIVLGLLPIMFRLSRAIWINIFIHYEGPCSDIPRK